MDDLREPQVRPRLTLPQVRDLLLVVACCVVAGLTLSGRSFGAAALFCPNRAEDPAAGGARQAAARSTSAIDPDDALTGLPFDFPGARTITVCPDGSCDYTTICDADCTARGSSCAGGSALAASRGKSSARSPYEIRVGPGRYDECVHIFSGNSYTSLAGSGPDISTIHPAVDLSTCPPPFFSCDEAIDGGAVSIAPIDDPDGPVEHVSITGFTIRNDSYSDENGGGEIPEGALMLGTKEGPGAAGGGELPDFENIHIWNNKIVGNRAGLVIRDYVQSAPAEHLPDVYLRDNLIVSGGTVLTLKGLERLWSRNNIYRAQTNYVETVDPRGFLGEVTGRVRKDSDSTWSQLFLETDDAPTGVLEPWGFYVGRRVRLSDNADPRTTCPARCVGRDYYIYQYDDAENRADLFSDYSTGGTSTFCDGTADPGAFPTTGCDYTIYAVGDPNNVGYRDSDWGTIRAAAIDDSHRGWWEIGGMVFGRFSNIEAQPWEHVFSSGDRIEVVVNDFGPHEFTTESNCRRKQVLTGGILSYDNPTYKVYFDNLSIHVELNHDLPPPESDPNAIFICPDRVGGYLIPRVDALAYFVDARLSGSIKIENHADEDTDLVGVMAAGTTPGPQTKLVISSLHMDITNTVPSYAGTTSHLSVSDNDTMIVGQITLSDQDPNITGLVVANAQTSAIDLAPGAVMFGSLTHDPNSMSGACRDLSETFTVPGADPGDHCHVQESEKVPGTTYSCRVEEDPAGPPPADNLVFIERCAVGASDPDSTTFRVKVTGR